MIFKSSRQHPSLQMIRQSHFFLGIDSFYNDELLIQEDKYECQLVLKLEKIELQA